MACGQRVKLANTCVAFATAMCENADLWTILSLKHCWNWENTHTHTRSSVSRTVDTELNMLQPCGFFDQKRNYSSAYRTRTHTLSHVHSAHGQRTHV